ncbi:MAG: YgaC family protein [Chloroflexi bacterium]|nr:YgaC family protein [Chloroflexota bacterium]
MPADDRRMMDSRGRGGRWKPGETAVLRFVWQRTVLYAWPCHVILDSADLVVLFVPDKTEYKRSSRIDGGRPLLLAPYVTGEDALWRRDFLRLMFPGHAYSIWLLWDVEPRRLVCWYVNLESPFVRTRIGFDTTDHELDVVIRPDRTWHLKDEDELDAIVRGSLIPEQSGREIRQTARQVIDLLEQGKSPFSDRWESWVPDPGWPAPKLPANWAELE